MTPTPERPDFAAAIDLLEGAARGLLMCGKRPLEERKKQATEMMDGVFALRAYPALAEDLAALDVLAFSLADFDKGVISAAILIDRLRAMLRERRAR